MGLEPMTSPLPRECSTTELHQRRYRQTKPNSSACLTLPRPQPCQHAAEREEPQQQPRHLLEPARLHRAPHQHRQQCQNDQRNDQPSVARRSHVHAAASVLQSVLLKNGAQGRIRTFVATSAADLQSAAINHSATCAHPACLPVAHSSTSDATEHRDLHGSLPALHLYWRTLQAGTTSRYNQTFATSNSIAAAAGCKNWSWRRDLNPRPPDYKSGALPAELRQPETATRVRNNYQTHVQLYHRNCAWETATAWLPHRNQNTPHPAGPLPPAATSRLRTKRIHPEREASLVTS